jgi:hypothetical protein
MAILLSCFWSSLPIGQSEKRITKMLELTLSLLMIDIMSRTCRSQTGTEPDTARAHS